MSTSEAQWMFVSSIFSIVLTFAFSPYAYWIIFYLWLWYLEYQCDKLWAQLKSRNLLGDEEMYRSYKRLHEEVEHLSDMLYGLSMPYKFFKMSSALSKTKRKAEFLRDDRALPGIINNDQVTQQDVEHSSSTLSHCLEAIQVHPSDRFPIPLRTQDDPTVMLNASDQDEYFGRPRRATYRDDPLSHRATQPSFARHLHPVNLTLRHPSGQMSEYSQHNRHGSATPQIAANDPATTRVIPLHRQPVPAPTRGRFSGRTGSSSVSSSGSPVNARSHNRSSMPNGDSDRHEGGGALHASTDRGTLDGERPPQPLDTSPTFPPTPDSLTTSPVLGRSPRDQKLGGESFMPIYSTEARASGIQRSTSSLHRRMSEGRSVRADSGELSGVEDDCDRWSTSSSVQLPPTPSSQCSDGRIYIRPGPSSAQHALSDSPVSLTL